MSITTDLSGRTALVTGASSAGFGAHFARVLAGNGARVVVAARRTDALDALVTEIVDAHGAAAAVPMDVVDPKSIARALDKAGPIDILVNNAGVASSGAALSQTDEDFDRVVDTNLKGVWRVSTHVARSMIGDRRGGSIINIASITALRQAGGVSSYAISKAGVVALTKQLALEWARHGIRVNALAPGYYATDLNRDFFETDAGQAMIRRIPQRRLGNYRDLDGPLLLLASDASCFMTGSVVTVDGGHLLSTL